MGRILQEGSLGNVRGRVGEAVNSKWRNLVVTKSRPCQRSEKQKEKVLIQQVSLPTMTHFLQFFVKPIKIGFHNKLSKLPAFQSAVKYNFEKALVGTFPQFRIDYKKVIFSLGDREIAWAGKVIAEGDGARISWEIPQTSKIKLIGEDIVNLVIYNATKDLNPEPVIPNTIRTDQSIFVSIERRSRADNLHFWLFFTSPDGKTRSNSQYMGSIGT